METSSGCKNTTKGRFTCENLYGLLRNLKWQRNINFLFTSQVIFLNILFEEGLRELTHFSYWRDYSIWKFHYRNISLNIDSKLLFYIKRWCKRILLIMTHESIIWPRNQTESRDLQKHPPEVFCRRDSATLSKRGSNADVFLWNLLNV